MGSSSSSSSSSSTSSSSSSSHHHVNFSSSIPTNNNNHHNNNHTNNPHHHERTPLLLGQSPVVKGLGLKEMEEDAMVLDNNDDSHDNGHMPRIRRDLTWPHLAMILFFLVSGGPYGCEQAVAASSPLAAILVFLLFPWIWALPMGMCTSELASAFPDEGGGMIEWVEGAFGVNMGKAAALFYWGASQIDCATYAILFPYYLESALMGYISFSSYGRIAISVLMVLAVAFINLSGIHSVSVSSMFFSILTVGPIILLSIYCVPSLDPSLWLSLSNELNPTDPDIISHPIRHWNWGLLLAVSIWCNSGFDDVGSLAAHVDNPQKTYPKAIMLTLILITFVNTIPLALALSADTDWKLWDEGYFTIIAGEVGPQWLKFGVSLGSLLCLFSELNVLILVTSKATEYMSRQQWLPEFLSYTRSDGTAWASILFACFLTLLLLPFNFELITELHTTLYACVIILENISFIILRIYRPDLPRPFLIPFGIKGLIVFFLPPIIICCMNIYFTSLIGHQLLIIFTIGAISIYIYNRWKYGPTPRDNDNNNNNKIISSASPSKGGITSKF